MKTLQHTSARFRIAIAGVAIAFCLQSEEPCVATVFHNLGFEEAVIDNPVNNQVPASDALPFWTSNGFFGDYILYDAVSYGTVCTSIQDASGYLKPLTGYYSVILQEGYSGGGVIDDCISQIGDVPPNAKSLMFCSDWMTFSYSLKVSLNGTVIPFSLYSVGDTVNPSNGPVKTYACDITAFTGMANVELRFTATGWLSEVDLDAIKFSPISVPEPSALVLFVVAALAASAYIFRRRASH
jgi:hypothetical protein